MNEIDTFEDFYLTYSTAMIYLIDTNTIETMMKRVIDDLTDNRCSIVERIQETDYDMKLLLGKSLYEWIFNNKGYWFALDNDFWDQFSLAFSKDIHDELKYLRSIRNFHQIVSIKKDRIIITTYTDLFFKIDTEINKAILKYNKKLSLLKLSYIETPFYKDSEYEVELFKKINSVYSEIKRIDTSLTFQFHKKYQDVYNKALQRGYLDNGIYKGQFN